MAVSLRRCRARQWRWRRRCVSRFGVPEGPHYYAPYATLPESSYAGLPTRDESAAHHLLYVGQFVQRKGLLPFLDVLARWSAAHKAAGGVLPDSLRPQEDAIRNFPLPQNLPVHLFGRRKPAEIAEFDATTGIFVLPTLADEWGLVVNEAMALEGRRCWALYSQAVEQLCENGMTG